MASENVWRNCDHKTYLLDFHQRANIVMQLFQSVEET